MAAIISTTTIFWTCLLTWFVLSCCFTTGWTRAQWRLGEQEQEEQKDSAAAVHHGGGYGRQEDVDRDEQERVAALSRLVSLLAPAAAGRSRQEEEGRRSSVAVLFPSSIDNYDQEYRRKMPGKNKRSETSVFNKCYFSPLQCTYVRRVRQQHNGQFKDSAPNTGGYEAKRKLMINRF